MKKINFEAKILPKPKAAFSRATKVNIGSTEIIFISGTASVGKSNESLHIGDFKSQVRRTYINIKALLAESGATFKDVASITVYLADIKKFYRQFNDIRDAFFKKHSILHNPPSSTCIEAKLCRPELLVEMSAIAIREIK